MEALDLGTQARGHVGAVGQEIRPLAGVRGQVEEQVPLRFAGRLDQLEASCVDERAQLVSVVDALGVGDQVVAGLIR